MLNILYFSGIPLVSTACAQGSGGCPWRDGGNWSMIRVGPGFGILGGVVSLLVWIAIIIGIVYLVRYIMTQGSVGRHRAADILKERYAKGEITKEQFEQMKKELQ